MRTLRLLLRTTRPPQWVKNLFVAAPALFAKTHTSRDPWLLLYAFLGFAIFVMVSGAVYVVNDILDVERDRLHPVKRMRPIASGELSVRRAVGFAVGLFAMGLLAASVMNELFLLAVLGYAFVNVAYSFGLKKVAYLDAVVVASGFLLRILAGCFAIGLAVEEISYFLVVCTFLVALFLALGKRRHELTLLSEVGTSHRESLGSYRAAHLDLALGTTAALTVIAYMVYTVSPRTVSYFGTYGLVFTVPLVVAGVARFLMLVRDSDSAGSPTDRMIRDKFFLGVLLLWVTTCAVVLYVLD